MAFGLKRQITVSGGVIRNVTDQPRPDTSKPRTKPRSPASHRPIAHLDRDRVFGIVSWVGIDLGLSGEQLKGLLAGVKKRL